MFSDLNGMRTGIKRLLFRQNKSGLTSLGQTVRIHHYNLEEDGGKTRVHLRLDPDDHGTLIVNANRIVHLNPTAALMAFLILENKSESEILRVICKRYKVGIEQAQGDLRSIKLQLSELTRPDGACPVHDLELDTLLPFSTKPSSPYRMDLAITYRCNNDCSHCYNARERNFPELSTDDWKKVLDKTWSLGIPHVVFTGGEPTLREDLPELINYAESLGQITGLNTNGRRLSDQNYVQRLVEAGLDHVQITVESHKADVHNAMVNSRAYDQTIAGVKNALASPLYVMTNTTMLSNNVSGIPETLDFLAELGVPTIGLNALIHSGHGSTVGTGLPDSALTPILEVAREKTESHGQRLIWYTPTQYCGFDPQALDLGVKGCTAALYNMCLEPNGDVLPCQSYYRPVGNILKDDWASIWNHKLCLQLRERQNLPAKCDGCELLAECGGGCPLQFESNSELTHQE